MKLPTVYPCANMTNLEWMAGQVAAGALSSHYGVVNKELVSRWIVEMAQEILAEVQRVERELPDLGD